MIKILLDAGANAEIPILSGKFLLHLALEFMAQEKKKGRSTENWFDIVTMLIDRGVAVDKPDLSQTYPIHQAIQNDMLDIATLLCEKAPHTVIAANSKVPGDACFRLVEVLVKAGANLMWTDDEGYTPLDRCIFTAVMRRQDRLPAIRLLAEAGTRLGPRTHTLGRSAVGNEA
nr:hypothetical protein BaRGS_032843 [Batillaria attramentaria]